MHAVVQWIDNDENLATVRAAAPNGFDLAGWKQQVAHLMELNEHNDGKLHKCTPRSLWLGIMKAANLALRFDLNECYLVPYGKQAVFQYDYRGLIKLVKRSGRVEHVKADVVREGDFIEYWRSPQTHFMHKPEPFNTGNITGVYALFYFTDGSFEYEVLNLDEIAAIRKKGASKSMMWNEFYEEGCKKAAIRRGIKTLELVPEDMRRIIEADRDEFSFAPATTSVEVLNQRLGLTSAAAPPQTPEEPSAEPVSPPPSEADGSEGDDEALRRSLGQLLKGISGDVEKAKERILGMDEADQSDWLIALKDADASERAALVEQIVGGDQ